MKILTFIRNHILPFWKTFIVICAPLLLLPLPILAIGTSTEKAAYCGYVILLMAVYWMTEALPLPITSLIPVVLFPLLGILDTGAVTMAYMKESNMMFMGNIMLALAVEYCNLHKRIALGVLLHVGSSPRWLMFGFMITTAFLSIWISNTGTTALMVPIVDAVIQELYKDDETDKQIEDSITPSSSSLNNTLTVVTESKEELVLDSPVVIISSSGSLSSPRQQMAEKERRRKIRIGTMMCISYSALIGGTGSLTGSSTQLAFKGILQQLFGSSTGLNYATWMAFNIPGMLINLLLAWLWLQLLFLGFKRNSDKNGDQKMKQLIRKKYRDLGPMSFHEFAVLLHFIACVLLWFFRDPQFMKGWANYITAVQVDDSTAVMAIMLLLFSIPAKPKFWCLRPKGETGPEKPSKALMDWKFIQEHLPWGIILLQGSGFAISDATTKSGLSTWLGEQLSGLSVLPPFAIMFIVCVMTAMITEVASNTATANILLPVLAETAIVIGMNPLYLMLPCTVTCSYAFMLPVATAPNAIVYTAANMKPVDMIKSGSVMNIICVIVICVMTETLGVAMFDFYTFPDWANKTTSVIPSPLPCFTQPITYSPFL